MKKTFLTLAMGMALTTGMVMTSCGGEKKTEGEQTTEEAAGEEKAEAKKALELPADCKVYDTNTMAAGKENTSANVAIDKKTGFISDGAFEGNAAIETLYFDHQIEMTGVAGFKDCKNLKEVKADSPIRFVSDNCFEGCTSLKEFDVETHSIGISGFEGCTSLEKVNIHRGFGVDGKGIDPYLFSRAFANCTALKTVIVPLTLDKFEDDVFEGCTAIEELALPYNFNKQIIKSTAKAKGIKKLFVLSIMPFGFPNTDAGKAFNKAQCTAYVPDALINDFKNDASWADFAAIKPLSESGYYDAEGNIK